MLDKVDLVCDKLEEFMKSNYFMILTLLFQYPKYNRYSYINLICLWSFAEIKLLAGCCYLTFVQYKFHSLYGYSTIHILKYTCHSCLYFHVWWKQFTLLRSRRKVHLPFLSFHIHIIAIVIEKTLRHLNLLQSNKERLQKVNWHSPTSTST